MNREEINEKLELYGRGYDQDRWAKELDYHGQNTDDALQLVKLARQTTYPLLETLPDGVFSHSVTHPEYSEPYTFDKWLNLYSAHIPGHIEQIKNNVRLWREQK